MTMVECHFTQPLEWPQWQNLFHMSPMFTRSHTILLPLGFTKDCVYVPTLPAGLPGTGLNSCYISNSRLIVQRLGRTELSTMYAMLTLNTCNLYVKKMFKLFFQLDISFIWNLLQNVKSHLTRNVPL